MKMQIRFVLVMLAAVLVGFGSWFLLMKKYWIKPNTNGITTFNSSEELFIFVPRHTLIVEESRAVALFQALAGSFPSTETISKEMLVFHYTHGKISRSKIESIGGGSPFAFQRNIYWGKGRQPNHSGPDHWQWNGSKFVPLSDFEWSEIAREYKKEFKLSSEANAKEGWAEKSLVLRGRKPELDLSLRGKDLRLVGKVESLSGNEERITITLNSTDGRVLEVLVNEVQGFKEISATDYSRLKGENSKYP